MRNSSFGIGILVVISIFFPLIFCASSLTLEEGDSFVHYVKLPEENVLLQKCTLHLSTEDISLLPNQIQNSQDLKSRLVPLENQCGFKLLNVNRKDDDDYNLTATISQGGKLVDVKENLSVQITAKAVLRNYTQLVSFGEADVRVKCSTSSSSGGLYSLYFPNGNLAYQSTFDEYRIYHITPEHIGKWKCDLSLNNHLEPVHTYITLELKKLPKIESWYKENNGYGVIGCKYIHRIAGEILKTCSMLTPKNDILKITPYSASKRYESVGTNFSQNICQIQFKLPAKPEEIGTWKCDLDRKLGFINVQKASKYAKETTIYAKLADPHHEAHCEVPYAASNCFVISPQGEIYYQGTAGDYGNGNCNFYLHNISATTFGTWTCHFSKPGVLDDDVIKINVERIDLIDPKFDKVTVDEGDEADILFVAHAPIMFCVLEDPKGNTYHIWPRTNTDTAAYFGRGFEFGECGMKLKKAATFHQGVWKCLTSTSQELDHKKYIIGTTVLEVNPKMPETATASSSAILIGLVVAVAFVVAFVVWGKFRQEKRKERVSPPNSLFDENSETAFALTAHL